MCVGERARHLLQTLALASRTPTAGEDAVKGRVDQLGRRLATRRRRPLCSRAAVGRTNNLLVNDSTSDPRSSPSVSGAASQPHP